MEASKTGVYDSNKVCHCGTSYDIKPEMDNPRIPKGQRLVVVFVWARTSLAIDISTSDMFEAFRLQYLRGNVIAPVFFLVPEEKLADCRL